MLNLPLNYYVRIAIPEDIKYAGMITNAMNESAVARRAPISLRDPEYIAEKINEEVAVIAIDPQTCEWVGFCYLEVWKHKQYVASSGLIVAPKYRGNSIAKKIKLKLFDLARSKFPGACIFSISTSPVVISANLELGFKKISYSKVLKDPSFLEGSSSAVNFVNLMNKPFSNYSAMLFDPENHPGKLAQPETGFPELVLCHK